MARLAHILLTEDMLFKLFFVKFPEYLKGLVAALLGMGEDLSQIIQTGGSLMAEVIEAWKSVAVSDELERLMEKAEHDEASARYQDRVEIAKNLKLDGVGIDTIARSTGLPVEDVLKL